MDRLCVKLAETLRKPLIVTVHVSTYAASHPFQPVKVHPTAGVAVRVTTSPAS